MTTLTSGPLLVDQTDGICRITFNRHGYPQRADTRDARVAVRGRASRSGFSGSGWHDSRWADERSRGVSRSLLIRSRPPTLPVSVSMSRSARTSWIGGLRFEAPPQRVLSQQVFGVQYVHSSGTRCLV